VCQYLRDFNSQQKTKNDSRGGTTSKLSEEQVQKLAEHISETTYLKASHICAYVYDTFGVKYSRSGMTKWLQANDFVFKRPKKVPGKMAPEKQEVFIAQYRNLKESLSDGEEIYFIDAVHPEHQSQLVCGWIKKDIQKTLQSTGKQLRLHFAGALRLHDMKVVAQEYQTVNAEAMIDFFKKLESSSTASVIHVILDNARANKNKKLKEFLRGSRIKLHYLPPYSPNLNPIERLWKIMREMKLYNRYYESSTAFFQAIRAFFQEDIPKYACTWSERINDCFQTIRLNPIKLAVPVSRPLA
jgi:transposase